jgi:hypothetical protein
MLKITVKIMKNKIQNISYGWEVKKQGEIDQKSKLKNIAMKKLPILTNLATQGIISQENYFDREEGNATTIDGVGDALGASCDITTKYDNCRGDLYGHLLTRVRATTCRGCPSGIPQVVPTTYQYQKATTRVASTITEYIN